MVSECQSLQVGEGLRQHTTAQQHGNLLGIDPIIFGLTAMDGLHIEGMAQHRGNPFLLTQVRQPLPRKHTFHADDEVLFIGSNDPQKGFRRRRHIFVDEFGAVLIEDTDVHGAGMEIDATIMFMLLCVEIHPGLLGGVKFRYSHPTAAR